MDYYMSLMEMQPFCGWQQGGQLVAPFRPHLAGHMRQVRRPLLCIFWLAVPVAYVPAWWRRGWPRGRVGSLAEAELLSELAVLLMPRADVGELFRSFPATKGWRGHSLEPDLAAYGILKDRNAALFVEYDGFWRHGEKEGIVKDQKKNEALLAYAPEGSFVVRITHTLRKPLVVGHTIWITAQTWRQGDELSLGKALRSTLKLLATGLRQVLRPSVLKLIHRTLTKDPWSFSVKGQKFVGKAAALAGKNSSAEVSNYFAAQGFCQQDIELMNHVIQLHSQSIEGNLGPKIQWLLELGLSSQQLAKAVAARPQILGYSIEQNLKPTVEWFLDLGLDSQQIAKAVAAFPQILGYSIEQNLKPTVEWFLDLGLDSQQIAKAVAAFPQILGYSIEQNLKPTVEWFLDLGLDSQQLAKAVAAFPQILGLSVEQNLKPTVEWLRDLGLSSQQLAKAVAARPQILGYSVEQNLKPTVEWLRDLGLDSQQIAKAVAAFPQILGLSIEHNLQPKSVLLKDYFSLEQVATLIAVCPRVFSYSYRRLSRRLRILSGQNKTADVVKAHMLPDADFSEKYGPQTQSKA